MSVLKLWPSIDLRGGRVVRLLKGELSQETVYELDPVEVARTFAAQGADGIHVVDLDAAFSQGDNAGAVEAILRAVSVPVQVGGGVKSREDVERLFALGASRVVLGSLPFTDPPLFGQILATHRDTIVVALDCKAGRPTIKGWTQDAGAGALAAVAGRMARAGVRALLVTDVARDGAMAGPNLELLKTVRSVFPGEVIASGGLRGEQDLGGVASALGGGPAGVIFGRALHEGRTDVARLRRERDAMLA
ncbi:MAG: 1-(5-phosphoribosyl)-5-[(5-phosphoribosylamino)methylideneamino] imidazole-4-carboxamide isomerase, partial [Thermoanaerobaculia bacterium]